jgi:hypothetical protein
MTALAIVLAVLGATLSAVGVQLQSKGVRDVAEDNRLRLKTLAHNRRWLAGLAVLVLCATLQILALAMAPVTVVAPIVVLALPVIVVLNARSTGTRLDATATFAVVASTGGVGLFVGLAAGAANSVAFDQRDVLQATQFVAVAVVLLAAGGAVTNGTTRCVAFAAGTGFAYGLVSVLVRDVTFTFQHSTVSLVSVLSLILSFAAGSWLLQLAYASGPPDIVVGCQTVLNPLVATALGIGVLDETVNAGGLRGLGLVIGGLLAIVGVVVLARHQPVAMTPVESRARSAESPPRDR